MKKLTVREIAERFGVGETAVYNWMKDGLLFTMEKVIGVKPRALIDPEDVHKNHDAKAVK